MGRNWYSALGVSACVLYFISLSGVSASSSSTPLTILHTNDIHSHFLPDKGDFKLGGVTRLASAIKREQMRSIYSVLFDGGDFSEGHVYYNLGGGYAWVEIMDALGYDAIAMGNHDFLSGPEHVIRVLDTVRPRFELLAANLKNDGSSEYEDFRRFIKSTKTLRRGPFKIGVIGLTTFEFLYDQFLDPIAIDQPLTVTKRLAKQLKAPCQSGDQDHCGVDLVVALSHNSFLINQAIATIPNVDIVIHAHDHEKFDQPVLVQKKNGKKAYLVEAFHWGFFLGRMDLLIDKKNQSFELQRYELIQIDDRLVPDPYVSTLVANYDEEVKQKYGNIFSDFIAEVDTDIRRKEPENTWGNLIADALLDYTKADFSMFHSSFTSGELHKGKIFLIDVLNALSTIYDPFTDKTWGAKVIKVYGEDIEEVLNSALGIFSFWPSASLSVGGITAIYDSLLGIDIDKEKKERKLLKYAEIQGEPLNPKKYYNIAIDEGILKTLNFLNKKWNGFISFEVVAEVGEKELWRIVADYMRKITFNGKIDLDRLPQRGRVSVLQPDLAVYHDYIEAKKDQRQKKVNFKIQVKNLGYSHSSERMLVISSDRTPEYAGDDPNPSERKQTYHVPQVPPHQSVTIEGSYPLKKGNENLKLPFYIWLNKGSDDPIRNNDGTWLVVH